MPLTKKQIMTIQAARRRVPSLRDEDTWRLVLRNCASVRRDAHDTPRLTHPRNDNVTFEEVMWRIEMMDETPGRSGHWEQKALARASRLQRAIRHFALRCEAAGLLERGGLDGFVERMTRNHEEHGAVTRDIDQCNVTQCWQIAEGLKAWMRGKAFRMRVPVPKFIESKEAV